MKHRKTLVVVALGTVGFGAWLLIPTASAWGNGTICWQGSTYTFADEPSYYEFLATHPGALEGTCVTTTTVAVTTPQTAPTTTTEATTSTTTSPSTSTTTASSSTTSPGPVSTVPPETTPSTASAPPSAPASTTSPAPVSTPAPMLPSTR